MISVESIDIIHGQVCLILVFSEQEELDLAFQVSRTVCYEEPYWCISCSKTSDTVFALRGQDALEILERFIATRSISIEGYLEDKEFHQTMTFPDSFMDLFEAQQEELKLFYEQERLLNQNLLRI